MCYSNDSKLQVSRRKSEIQDGVFENPVTQISAYTHESNEIPTANPDYWKYSPMSGRVGNQRWRPLTGIR